MGSGVYGASAAGTWKHAVCGGLAGLALCLALGPVGVQPAEAAPTASTDAAASSAVSAETAASAGGASTGSLSGTSGQAASDEAAAGTDGSAGDGNSSSAAGTSDASSSDTTASSESSAASGSQGTAASSGSSSQTEGDSSKDGTSQTEPTVELDTPVIQRIEAQGKGILLEWGRIAHADGYDIYRWTEGAEPVRVAHLKSPLRRSWTDKKAAADQAYYYRVVAYAQVEASADTDAAETAQAKQAAAQNDASASNTADSNTTTGSGTALGGSKLVEQPSAAVECLALSAPSVTSFSKKASATTAKVAWSTNASAAGYQVQYSRDALFVSYKTVWVRDAATGSAVLSKLKANRTYYVRVRAYADAGGVRCYSPWSGRACAQTKTRTLSKLKVGKKTFEIRSAARQKVYGYDTLQGSCSDGTYGYFALYNRTRENCEIAKVRLADRTVVKVSGVLDTAHANDMTYNADDHILVVARCTTNKERFTAVDPDALTVVGTFEPSLDAAALGISEKKRAGITGFASIAYCAARQQYAVVTKGGRDLLILDRAFEPVRFLDIPHLQHCNYQGIEVTDAYINLCLSPVGKGSNRIVSYSWDGASIGEVVPGIAGEFEGMFIAGGKCYLGTYVSAYETAYRKVKVVKRVVKKKRVTVVRMVHGKKKRVKMIRKKTVRVTKVKYVPYQRLRRDNYLYLA